MSEIRICPLSDKQVVIAPQRLHRPMQVVSQSIEDDIALCPFERGAEDATPHEIFSIKDKNGDWICKVVPNLYRALNIEEEKFSQREGFFTFQSGLGAHEVIIETPNHNLKPNEYTLEQYKAYLRTIITRINDLSLDTRLEYIQIFKNHGAKAGASLKHPHSQIIANAFIPSSIDTLIEKQRKYFKQHKRSLLQDIVYEELRIGKRVIYENDDFVAFSPYASAYAFEIMIVPKIQLHTITAITVAQKSALAHTLKASYQALFSLLGDVDFNLMIHNAPPKRENSDPDYFYQIEQFYTFYLHITPRIYTLAGYELSSGVHINPVTPEDATQKLKEEIKS